MLEGEMKAFVWQGPGLTDAYGNDGFIVMVADTVGGARQLAKDYDDKLHDAYELDAEEERIFSSWVGKDTMSGMNPEEQDAWMANCNKRGELQGQRDTIINEVAEKSGMVSSYNLYFGREANYPCHLDFILNTEPRVIELTPRILAYNYGYEG